MTTRAKTLRHNPADPEKRLWRLLYPFRSTHFHFRKQAPIGAYCVDFACHHAKLVIEVDGDTHDLPGAKAHDAERDAFLESQGYTVSRFTNIEVRENPEGVYLTIENTLNDRPPNTRTLSPSPLVGRVGEGVL